MTRAVILDTGPLGRIAHPKAQVEVAEWYRRCLEAGIQFVVPEIADYELRRELVRADLKQSLQRLDALGKAVRYVPLTTSVMRRAAQLWARMRNEHTPTADDKALDGDVILAAQAEALAGDYGEVVIATENIGHLDRMVPARNWSDI